MPLTVYILPQTEMKYNSQNAQTLGKIETFFCAKCAGAGRTKKDELLRLFFFYWLDDMICYHIPVIFLNESDCLFVSFESNAFISACASETFCHIDFITMNCHNFLSPFDFLNKLYHNKITMSSKIFKVFAVIGTLAFFGFGRASALAEMQILL